jgi:hypothetical protein
MRVLGSALRAYFVGLASNASQAWDLGTNIRHRRYCVGAAGTVVGKVLIVSAVLRR